MRKFNSALAIVAVALASVFGFSSCDKNEDSFNQATVQTQAKQVEKKTSGISLLVAMMDGQQNFVDQTYTIEMNGQKQVVKMADLKEIAKPTDYTTKVIGADGDEADVKYYSYNLGTTTAGQSVKVSLQLDNIAQSGNEFPFDFCVSYEIAASNAAVSGQFMSNTFNGSTYDSLTDLLAEINTSSTAPHTFTLQ